MHNNDNFGRISFALTAILGKGRLESYHAWGGTNYLDMRIILVLNYLRSKRRLTLEHVQQLSLLYEDFLKCMVQDDNTYQLYGGTYKLLRPTETVRQAFREAAQTLAAKESKRSWAQWLSWTSWSPHESRVDSRT